METINFSKRTGFIIFLILLFVIFLILMSWKDSQQNEPDESKLSFLIRRFRKLSHEIEEEVRTLKLTQEMKILVDKKISQLFKLVKLTFITTFILIATAFYWQSHEVFSSIMNTVGLFVFLCGTCSFLLANRFAESNSIIKTVSMAIRKWVYKKYGYDPSEEKLLELSIYEKRTEASLLVVEISRLNTSNSFVNK